MSQLRARLSLECEQFGEKNVGKRKTHLFTREPETLNELDIGLVQDIGRNLTYFGRGRGCLLSEETKKGRMRGGGVVLQLFFNKGKGEAQLRNMIGDRRENNFGHGTEAGVRDSIKSGLRKPLLAGKEKGGGGGEQRGAHGWGNV